MFTCKSKVWIDLLDTSEIFVSTVGLSDASHTATVLVSSAKSGRLLRQILLLRDPSHTVLAHNRSSLNQVFGPHNLFFLPAH